MKSVRGNVLVVVLGSLLILSILLSVMLRLPGALRRTVRLVAKETQEMYEAESAVLAKLEGVPAVFLAGLPQVESSVLGPWTEWRTSKFQFLLGNEFGRFGTSEWMSCVVLLEQNLRNRILLSNDIIALSGNRRFFQLDSSVVLNVSSGDLTLDLGGNAFDGSAERPFVRSFMAYVEGDVKIRGTVLFDTLRVYASGKVLLQGNVDARFVEVFGSAGVEVSGRVSLAGALLSKQNIEISGRAQMKFPSVAVAVGYRGNRVALRGKSAFGGLAVAPSGIFERDSSTMLLDSTQALLPFCMDSRKVVFDRRRL